MITFFCLINPHKKKELLNFVTRFGKAPIEINLIYNTRFQICQEKFGKKIWPSFGKKLPFGSLKTCLE
jgi:hypothetical protein